MGNWARVYYANLMSAPLLAGVLLFSYQERALLAATKWTLWTAGPTLLSCVVGVAMSHASYLLRSHAAATTAAVVGIVCKLLSVTINLVIWCAARERRGPLLVAAALRQWRCVRELLGRRASCSADAHANVPAHPTRASPCVPATGTSTRALCSSPSSSWAYSPRQRTSATRCCALSLYAAHAYPQGSLCGCAACAACQGRSVPRPQRAKAGVADTRALRLPPMQASTHAERLRRRRREGHQAAVLKSAAQLATSCVCLGVPAGRADTRPSLMASRPGKRPCVPAIPPFLPCTATVCPQTQSCCCPRVICGAHASPSSPSLVK